MFEFSVKTTGKAKILSTERIQAPNNPHQNWWLLTLENGPTSFTLHVPVSRDRAVTAKYKKMFCTGNVISFESTPDQGREMCTKLLGVAPPQGQAVMDFSPRQQEAA